MSTSVKINSLELLNTAEYELIGLDLPYSLVKTHFKEITLKIICNGATVDGAIANEKLIFDELYKIKPDKRDCILKIKLDGSANTTYYDVVSYRLESRDMFVLVTNKKIVLELILTVLNYGYSDNIALGTVGVPHVTKTLPDYFDIVNNLNQNPSIEIDLDGYGVIKGGEILTRVTDEYYSGIASCKIVTPNSFPNEGIDREVPDETVAGIEYTFSAYLKGSGTVQLSFFDSLSGYQKGSQITLTSTWTRYSLTKTFTADSIMRRFLIFTDVTQGITFYCDALMHSEGSILYAYCEKNIRGEINAYSELNMKLLSADDVDSIYYGIKSEKLISDITNFNPILEAEDQTLTNATKVVNLNANPSIEVDTSGYTSDSSSISRDTVEYYKGLASLKCITNDWGIEEGFNRYVTSESEAGTEYTFSVYLKGSGTVKLKFYDNVTGSQSGSQITLSSTWTRHSLTKTFGAGSTSRRLDVVTDVKQLITFYSDALMHTEGSTLYPYFTGDARNNSSAYTNATYPTIDWATYLKFSLNNANYKGRYLVLARVYNEIYDAPVDFIKIRLKCGDLYSDGYSFSNEETNKWQVVELGEIQVPYSETQATNSDYEIQLKGEYGTNRFAIDYIALIPIDETFGIRKSEILAITQNDIYKIDTLSKIPSALLQNINDNNNYDRGNFIYLPKGNVRVVIISDNNAENKITDQMSFWLNYYSRYFYLRGDD